MRRRLLNGRDADSLLCVYVGRLATEKRIDLLLDVARTPGVALTIVGDGAQREQLEAQFAATDAHFTGYLIGDELAEAYASADVFAFPGECETFGQVIQEAMASGLPCVVADAGGAPDVLDDGGCGLVVAPTRRDFANAVRTLRDQPWRRGGDGAPLADTGGRAPLVGIDGAVGTLLRRSLVAESALCAAIWRDALSHAAVDSAAVGAASARLVLTP